MQLRQDETRLVIILVSLFVVVFLGRPILPDTALASLVIVLCVAGALQGASMYIRWLFYVFIAFVVLVLTLSVAFLGVFGSGFIGYMDFVYTLILLGSLGALFLWAEQYGILHQLLKKGMPESLHTRDTLSEWGKVIYGARGMRDQFWEILIKHLEDIDVSGITWSHRVFAEKVGTLTSKTKGISRKCLIVEAVNQDYLIIVGAWDFGKYLAVRRLIWMRKVKKLDYRLKPEDFFKDDVSTLFRSVVHLAVESAVKDLCEEAQIEKHDIQDMLEAW